MTIVNNRKAFHDYSIEDLFIAGVKLEGWEVKSIRAGRVQLKEAYVMARDSEIFLIGAHISPLLTASTHVETDATRTRKLLLTSAEIKKLTGKVMRAGYTMVPINLQFVRGRVKCEFGLAKGKQLHDKREAQKDKDAQREQSQAMKQNAR